MSGLGIQDITSEILPMEEMLAIANKKSSLKIGVLAEYDSDEKRVCLTPESVGHLVENGHRIIVQSKAGEKSGYKDLLFSEQGAVIVDSFEEVMLCDIVLKVSRLNTSELQSIRKGQLIITSIQYFSLSQNDIRLIAQKKATAISFEDIMDNAQAFPLIRSMSEIVGVVAVQVAAHYLSHPKYGNATLLGGIPGVSPAEVVVIGAGAKILGPITLGNDVRVGSNSVVVKSVDNAQTVVGVPARVLKDSKTKTDHFESYAVGTDVDDPTVKAINSILSHIHDMDEQLNIVSKKLDIKDQDDIDVGKLEIESK